MSLDHLIFPKTWFLMHTIFHRITGFTFVINMETRCGYWISKEQGSAWADIWSSDSDLDDFWLHYWSFVLVDMQAGFWILQVSLSLQAHLHSGGMRWVCRRIGTLPLIRKHSRLICWRLFCRSPPPPWQATFRDCCIFIDLKCKLLQAGIAQLSTVATRHGSASSHSMLGLMYLCPYCSTSKSPVSSRVPTLGGYNITQLHSFTSVDGQLLHISKQKHAETQEKSVLHWHAWVCWGKFLVQASSMLL